MASGPTTPDLSGSDMGAVWEELSFSAATAPFAGQGTSGVVYHNQNLFAQPDIGKVMEVAALPTGG